MNAAFATDASLLTPNDSGPQPAPATASDAAGTQAAATEAAEGAAQAEGGPGPRKRGGGPRTQAGRNRSRWNSSRHSLTGTILLTEELRAAVARHTEELTRLYQPSNEHERTLISNMARARATREHAASVLVVHLLRLMERAAIAWDLDREAALDKPIGRLHTDMRVSGVLARLKQGAEWLLERWARLSWSLDANNAWTDDQCSFALDLLGVEPQFRAEHPVIRPDADVATLKQVVAEEVERLKRLLDEKLLALDEGQREAAKGGLRPEVDATIKNLMTYGNRAWRAYQRLKQELLEYRAQPAAAKGDDAAVSPAAATAAAATPAPAAAPAAASAASGKRRAAPAPTARPVATKAEQEFLSQRWYYDTLITRERVNEDEEGSEDGDELWDEEPAVDEESAPAPAPAAARSEASPERGARTVPVPQPAADPARAREEAERRRQRAEERKARNKARRR